MRDFGRSWRLRPEVKCSSGTELSETLTLIWFIFGCFCDVAISRLQQIYKIVEDVNTKSKQLASSYDETLDVFSADFDRLSLEYSTEYDQYALDEVVVGAIAPYVSLEAYHPPARPSLSL